MRKRCGRLRLPYAFSEQGVAMLSSVLRSPRAVQVNIAIMYDIYHMQIMEGDLTRTVQQNLKYIGHFHTAGNPGRHEFDDTQEMNYRGICQAIADLSCHRRPKACLIGLRLWL